MSGAFSHSRLTLLDDCPRRYRYRYVEKVPEGFQTADAFMGTVVHDALQWLYMERESKREPSENDLVARFRATWREKLGPSVKVVQEDGSFEAFERDGEAMLRRHWRGTFADDRMETLAVEPKITIDLAPQPGDTASYVGYIDRLARDAQGTLHVIDYKTGKRVPRDMGEAGLQVRGYGLGVLEKHGGTEVALRYEYLRHDRHLSETMLRAHGPAVAKALSDRILRALKAEEAGEFPARPSALCRWCGYREICDASPFHEVKAAPAPAPRVAAPSLGTCPLCGGGLRLRVSSRSELVACERYPDCRHARDASADELSQAAPKGSRP